MRGKALVIDANILVRAVLGKRVREILEGYADMRYSLYPKPHMPKLKRTYPRS